MLRWFSTPVDTRLAEGGLVAFVGKALTIVLGAALGVAATALWQLATAALLVRQAGGAASDLAPAIDRLLPVYVLPAFPGAVLAGATLGWLVVRRRRRPSPMATTLLGLAATSANYATLALWAAFERAHGAGGAVLTRSLPEHFISAGLTTIPIWIVLAWLLRVLARHARITAVAIPLALLATAAMLWPARPALSVRLVEAARNGTVAEILALQALGAHAGARDGEGRTVLMFIAARGHPWLAQLLLWRGADPNARARDGATALHAASGSVVPVLVAAGAHPDARNGAGLTPLVAAAEKGRFDAVKALRAAGARGEPRFNAPLLEAARRGDADGVRKWAYIAADLHAPDASGRTALAWAVERGDAEMIRILGGAARYAGPPPGPVAVVETARPAPPPAEWVAPIPDALLDEHGTTRLMRAAARGDLAEVRGLLAGRANVDARDRRSGFTALHLAAESGQPDVVAALIQGGAAIEARTAHDATPLMIAAQGGKVDAVKVLLRAGADLGARTEAGMTALAQAAAWGQVKMVRFLIAVGADVNEAEPVAAPLVAVVLSQNVDPPRRLETVKAVLQAGADPISRLRDGSTALAVAERQGDREVVKLLSDAAKR
jgi:cytohesin